ncbi:hypothetical protein ACRYCC_27760 [Actinomadura scrupuli]|uniref:hypothetical protein n=1 Tax=Actinomadura scrupuli TaxID=559629 RepID=UPI003D981F98
MLLSRPLRSLAALTCAGALVACGSEAEQPADPTATPSVSAPGPSSAAADACPRPAEIVKAMDARGWTGFRVRGSVVCDGDWATATVQQTAVSTDPARAVLRRKDGRLRAVIYGTDALCGNPGVRPAPQKIKRALGAYC